MLHHTSSFMIYHAEDIGADKDMTPNWANLLTLRLSLLDSDKVSPEALARILWDHCPLPGQQRLALFALGAVCAEAIPLSPAFQTQEVLQLAYTLGCARGKTKALLKRLAGKTKTLDEAEKVTPTQIPHDYAGQALRMARNVVVLADLLHTDDPNEVLGEKRGKAYAAIFGDYADMRTAKKLYDDRLSRREYILQLDGAVFWNGDYNDTKMRTFLTAQTFVPNIVKELQMFLLALVARAKGQPIQMEKAA